MYPILFTIGEYVFPSWHVFFILAFVIAGLQSLVLAQYLDLDLSAVKKIFVLVYLGGYFGARAFNILVEEGLSFNETLVSFLDRLIQLGGMTFYGGMLSAILLGYLGAYLLFKKPLERSKAFFLGICCGFLGLGIGRIGCFLNGDDFGKPISDTYPSFLATIIPPLEDNLLRYPVQLWEAGLAFLLFFIGRRWILNQKTRNFEFSAYGLLSIYCVFRFIIEYFRGDVRAMFFEDALSISQLVSLCLLIFVFLKLLIKFSNNSKINNT